jgi:hypothetical protein
MATAATPMPAAPAAATGKNNRGQDQLNWPKSRFDLVDAAVVEEMTATRVGGKFLKVVHVPKNVKTVPADQVIVPTPPTPTNPLPPGTTFDPALSSSETVTKMIQEPSIEFFLTSAQKEDEASEEMEMSQGQGASTFFSLSIKAANKLAQVEDLMIFNGQNAFYHPLLAPPYSLVQFKDKNVGQDLDLGLLNIQPKTPMGPGGTPAPSGPNAIMLPGAQVVQVPPSPSTPPGSPPWYLDHILDGFAVAVSILNGNGYLENYFGVVHQYIFADLHRALPTTLITTAEPVSHLLTAGLYAGIVPPFVLPAAPGQYGLPTQISDGTPIIGNVLYTGVLGSLSGNSMDLVRGILDVGPDSNPLDVAVTFLQKDPTENYRFRGSERFAGRVKDTLALVVLLFMDFVPTQLAFTAQPASAPTGATIGAVTVQVQDDSGHMVTGSTAPVTIAIGTNPGKGTLSGTLTVNAVAGNATFPGLSINQPGTGYTLVATSPGLGSVTSAPFNIT